MASSLLHRVTRRCVARLTSAPRAFSSGTKVTAGGFSFPAPRALSQIVKLELLENEQLEEIKTIWEQFHAEKDDSIATTLSAESYKSLVERAGASPFFIFPVYRQDGFFNMLCQFQDTCFLVTYLEAFKENPALAPPCLTISLYDDMLEKKEIGLIRADVVNMLDKKVSARTTPLTLCKGDAKSRKRTNRQPPTHASTYLSLRRNPKRC